MTEAQDGREPLDAGALDDFAPGVGVVREFRGRKIIIIRFKDELFALRNVCPHQTQSFEGGRVHYEFDADGEPGQLRVKRDEPVIACPWHAWTFSLRDGHCTVDAKLRVKTYDVKVVDGRVLVDEARRPAPAVA
jgi:nitrite reductase/ring-hydroxylating ferredoxin subunit